jgi:hypothetical protein
MNCFVIMPFDEEFDDVYSSVKASVEEAAPAGCRCLRLDESRPAGNITQRLVSELKVASFCVADLTGLRPNVMWELGYVMALTKPTLVITQDKASLPFDVFDLQKLEYDRKRLSRTLDVPLRSMVMDTLSAPRQTLARSKDEQPDLIAQMRDELVSLRGMVSQVVQAWEPKSSDRTESPMPTALSRLEGAWSTDDSGTHLYSKIIDGDLIVPYCYRGNDGLTGVYYGWRRIGDFWFARFKWLDGSFRGFTFLRQDSVDVLHGAWWTSTDGEDVPTAPPNKSGVPSTWRRAASTLTADWAARFFREVKHNGLAGHLAESLKRRGRR